VPAFAQAPPPPPLPGTRAPAPAQKFFRIEGSGSLALNEGGIGGRATVAYAFGRVFSIHAGMRLLGDDADIENDLHAGFGIRANTAGPLSFTFTPELVLGEREKLGGGFRIAALYTLIPHSVDMSAGLQVLGGDFDIMLLGEVGAVLYF
jgi:hypothetical protein